MNHEGTKTQSWRQQAGPSFLFSFASCLCAFVVCSQLSTPVFAQPASPNRVLELDGAGSYVELPANIFNDLTEATVEVWVRWDDLGGTAKRVFNYGDALRDMSLYSGNDPTTLRFVVAGPSGKLEDLRFVTAEGFLL